MNRDCPVYETDLPHLCCPATSALRGAGHPEAAETVPGMLGEVWESPMATLRDEGPSGMPEMTLFSQVRTTDNY